MEVVRALAEEIGPRLACSEEEERAAQWCATRLSEAGLAVEIQEFPSRASYVPWYVVYLSISMVGALLIVVLPLVAAGLGAVGAVLYARDADGRPVVRPRTGVSRNVVARRGGGPPRLIIVAHMDSARSSPSFHPKLVGSLRASVVVLNAVLLAVPLTGGVAWVAESTEELGMGWWIPAGLLATYLFIVIGLLAYGHRRMEVVPGANDNASGIAVSMRLAEMRLPGMWFLVTGSEEAGMLGIQAFIDAHGSSVRATHFLNLDHLGAGTLIAATEEGAIKARRADREMLIAAEEAGAELRPYRGLPTDATVLQARRFRALSLLAVDERGLLPHWHWPTDVPANVDSAALDRATEIAAKIIAKLAERQSSQPEASV